MPELAYQLKATIVGTKLPVSRRLLVLKVATLFKFHDVLKAVFVWWNCPTRHTGHDGIRATIAK